MSQVEEQGNTTEPTVVDVLDRANDCLDAVQSAQGDLVRGAQALAAHINDPSAHGTSGTFGGHVADINDADISAYPEGALVTTDEPVGGSAEAVLAEMEQALSGDSDKAPSSAAVRAAIDPLARVLSMDPGADADDVAAAHNCIYRGKDLTNVYTLAELSAKLAAGDFSDLYIGDYITYPFTHGGETKNVNFRFGHFNYWKYMGDGDGAGVVNGNHILMVPDTYLYLSQMQTSNTTAGGVPASIVWAALQAGTYNEVNAAACMNGHVVTHRDWIPDSVNNSAASDCGAGFTGSTVYTTTMWRDVKLGLMKEPMVYGGKVFSSSGYDIACGKSQIALFRLDPTWITGRAARYNWWLGAVSSSTAFASANGNGSATSHYASNSLGVRPYFLFA